MNHFVSSQTAHRSKTTYLGPSAASKIIAPVDLAAWHSEFVIPIGPKQTLRCSAIYDQGTAKVIEDVAAITFPHFAVADGVTGIHLPGRVPTNRAGDSLGREAALTLRQSIQDANINDLPEDVARKANDKLREIYRKRSSLHEPALRGGTTGALLSLGQDTLNWAQWGDAFVLYQLRDGSVFSSWNQLAAHDSEMYAKIAELMKEGGRALYQDRTQLTDPELNEVRSRYMWPRFTPFLREKRNQRINGTEHGSYGLLNGERAFPSCVRSGSVDLAELDVAVIATDGFLEIEKRSGEVIGAAELLSAVKNEKLVTVLERQRERERSRAQSAHISHQEATAIVLCFSTNF